MKKGQLAGILALSGSTLVYSTYGLLSRLVEHDFPLYYGFFTRGLVFTLIAGMVLLLSKSWKKVKQEHYKWYIIRSVSGLIAMMCFFVAITNIPFGITYFIFYGCMTLGGYVMGVTLFKESLTKIKIISLILALIGLYFIYQLGSSDASPMYALLAGISGIMTAVWNTISKKITEHYSLSQTVFLDNLLITFYELIISLTLAEQWVGFSVNRAWGLNVLYGAVLYITSPLVAYGFKRLESSIGSLIMLSEILFGIIIGQIVYGEVVSVLGYIGGAFIIASMVLPELVHNEIKKRKKT